MQTDPWGTQAPMKKHRRENYCLSLLHADYQIQYLSNSGFVLFSTHPLSLCQAVAHRLASLERTSDPKRKIPPSSGWDVYERNKFI